MTDLPDTAQQNAPPAQPSAPISVSSVGGKEVEAVSARTQEGLRDASGQEIELPPEVASAGVKVHPTTIPVPPFVSKLGVKPTGQNMPTQTTSTVVLPISDDQIVAGLHQGITSSWRWLSVWCERRLKQVHLVLKSIHGKIIRVKI